MYLKYASSTSSWVPRRLTKVQKTCFYVSAYQSSILPVQTLSNCINFIRSAKIERSKVGNYEGLSNRLKKSLDLLDSGNLGT